MMTSGLYMENIQPSPNFWVIFGISILINSCNRLKYVFEQIIFIAAIKNIYFPIKINKNMKFYFIWEDLVHFSTVTLN